jgi:uncharacterized protein (DUF1778 family)
MVKGSADEQMHIRIRDADRQRIDHAAELGGTTRSAFVLAAALEKANAVVFDRVHYAWPEAAVAAFHAVLAEPPAPAPRAEAAMEGAKQWSGG